MRSDGFARRLLVGVLLAASLLVVAHFATRSSAASRGNVDLDSAAPRAPVVPADVSGVLAGPGAIVIYLAARPVDLPTPVAPVVAVAAGGGLRLVRQPPPEPEAGPWIAAGIVLPGPQLEGLDAGARASLLEMVGAFAQGRPLARSDVVLCGVTATDDAVATLLRWMR